MRKNKWYLLLFILCGLVIGGFLGEYLGGYDLFRFLNYGKNFGITTPLTLDLDLFKITFGFVFKINIASIIGMMISIFVFRKL